MRTFNIIKDLEFVKVEEFLPDMYIRYPAKCFDDNYQIFFIPKKPKPLMTKTLPGLLTSLEISQVLSPNNTCNLAVVRVNSLSLLILLTILKHQKSDWLWSLVITS